ncbi:hypothetical protein [Paenibacillus sp. RC67]|uniref:hypothetical protein n=1 Tax=Paenibacillus sp. RC67 TaxID=3039392 RepID=UPI0024AD84C0|nr:hypothetical protein [Paenibacillus sp. RC67]
MVVVGCSGGGQGSPAGEAAATKAPSSSNAPEGQKAPLKLSIMATYYTPQPPNNQSDIWKKLQEMTNTQIDMTWVPRSAYDDKVSVSIASNDLPQGAARTELILPALGECD